MAGDWIKMRTGLRNHPKVVRIASALLADRFRVVGGLHAVWCLIDEFSEDGILNGYSYSLIDEIIGWPGFSEAMAQVGWLFMDGQAVVCPEFLTHNGASAKRRAQEMDRKRSVRNVSASNADEMRTRGEERREEVKAITSPDGDVGDFQLEPVTKLNGNARPKPVPFEQIIALYHEKLPTLPKVEKLTPKRQGQIRQRWSDDLTELPHWSNFFEYVSESDFLMGRKPGSNGRPPFRADIEWLTNATNFTAIAEGKYHR